MAVYSYQILRQIYLFVVLLIPLVGCQSVQSNSQLAQPLPQDNLVRVYFNHSLTSEYKNPYRQVTRLGDDLEQQIIDNIQKAKSNIDIAIQELRLPRIAQALVKKHQQGVKIRVILENSYSRPASNFSAPEINRLAKREKSRYQDYQNFIDMNQDGRLSPTEINQRDALSILFNAKIPWIDDTADGTKGSGLMHHKFLIVDNRFVLVSSANFTLSDIHGDYTQNQTNPGNLASENNHNTSVGNANNLVVIDSVEVAAVFQQEFDLMWGNGERGNQTSKFGLQKPFRPPQRIQVGKNRLTINFSPISPTQDWQSSSNGLIAQKLSQAKQSIDLALFVFSDQKLADALATNQTKNIRIRGLFEPTFAFRYYSEALDLSGVSRSHKCSYEADNNPWKTPAAVAIPQLAQGDLLHHKFANIDDKIIITGSHNWSGAANHQNDETLLIIENPTVAAHFRQEIERLYANSIPGLPARIQSRIVAEKQKCPQIKIKKNYLNSRSNPVNINTASAPELESLPGIGKKLAQRIIIARSRKPLQSVSDLEKIPGIRQTTIAKISDRIIFQAPE